MSDQIIIDNIPVDCLDLGSVMERFDEFTQNDHLNTIAFVTRALLVDAANDELWRDYLRRVDLGVIDEEEILRAVGSADGQIAEEVAAHQAPSRIFWQIVKRDMSVFLLCDSEQERRHLKDFFVENHPGIRIVGETDRVLDLGADADRLINALNSSAPDVIISGLSGTGQSRFIVQHQNKVFGKIWIHLGGSPRLRAAAGLKKRGWFESRKIARSFQELFVENE